MTPLDEARLAFELHANALERAIGRGGAPMDMQRARIELAATMAALLTLTAEVTKEATCESRT